MNTAIAKAMFREQFQRTLPILILSLGISTVPCIILYTVRRAIEHISRIAVTADEELAVSAIFLAHAVGIIGLLYCHSDERDIKLNMPNYLLRLPIRTFDLNVYRMGYGLLFVGAIGIGSSSVYYLLFGQEMEAIFPFWTPILYGITMFAFLQALAWCIGGSGFGVILTALTIHLLVDGLIFDFDSELGDLSGYMTVDALSLIAISFLVAYAGVRTRRREGLNITRMLGPLSSMIDRDRGVDRPPFASPDEAMRWFEWRRQGRMLPVFALFGAIVFSIYALFQLPNALFERYSWNSAMTVYSVTVVMGFYTALGSTALFFGAYSFFQNQRIQLGPQKTFLFIRPVSTKNLASARIAATLRSVLISIPPFAVVCAITVFFAARSNDNDPNGLPGFVQEHIGLDGAAIAILLLLGIITAIWCVQWFGNLLAFGTIFTVGAWVYITIVALKSLLTETESLFESEVFATNAVLICALVCAFLFYLAHRRGLLETKNFFIALAASPFLAAGFWTFFNWDNIQYGEPYAYAHLAEIIPFAVLPLAPLATVPLIMHFARHR